jgi:glycosyltransferase involved in cell wall biosynthesis
MAAVLSQIKACFWPVRMSMPQQTLDLHLREILRRGNGPKPQVSIVATFHREGLYAQWMLDGFSRARAHAQAHGVGIEMICVLDAPDEDTRTVVLAHSVIAENDTVLVVQSADAGTNRNIGASFARADFIGMVDGDDYVSEAWITKAYEQLQTYGASAAVHPEYVVSFGTEHSLTKLIDQRYDDFPLAACIATHPWVCTVLAHRVIFEKVPYQPTRSHETGFGYEDWHWNLEVLSKGVVHILASETALYYRRKPVSVLSQETKHKSLVRPSAFFEFPEFWRSGFGLIDEFRLLSKDIPQVYSLRNKMRSVA